MMGEETSKVSVDLGRPVFQQFEAVTINQFFGTHSDPSGSHLKLDPSGDVAIFLSRVLEVALETVKFEKSLVFKIREVKMGDHKKGYTKKRDEFAFGSSYTFCPTCDVSAGECNFKGQPERITDITSEQVTLLVTVSQKIVPRADHRSSYSSRPVALYSKAYFDGLTEQQWCSECNAAASSCTFKGDETVDIVVKLSFRKRAAINEDPNLPKEILLERTAIEISGWKEAVEKITTHANFQKVVEELKARDPKTLTASPKAGDGKRRGKTVVFDHGRGSGDRVRAPRPDSTFMGPTPIERDFRLGSSDRFTPSRRDSDSLPRVGTPFPPRRDASASLSNPHAPLGRRHRY